MLHRLPPRLLILVSIACLCLAFTITPLAGARPLAPTSSTISVTPFSGWQNTPVRVAGSGFQVGEQVNLYFDATLVNTTHAGCTGARGIQQFQNAGCVTATFETTIAAPPSAIPGSHIIRAIGQQSRRRVQASFYLLANWPQFRFGLTGAGSNPYETTLGTSNVSTLGTMWTFNMFANTYSAPVVTNGVVYMGKSLMGELLAVDASRGTLLWQINSIDSSIDTTPTVANGAVYVTAGDGYLHVYGAAGCGSAVCGPLWSGFTGVSSGIPSSSPTVANGVVYVGSEQDNALYAFDSSGCGSATCQPLWIGTMASTDSTPAVVNGVVYLGASDDKLYAFNSSGCGSSTCSPLWTGTAGGRIFTSPAVAYGLVYVSAQDESVYAFNAAGCGSSTCSPVWVTPLGSPTVSSAAVWNGVVYVATTGGTFYALDATNGSILWSASIESSGASPTVANGVVYIGASNGLEGKLYAFNAAGCGSPICSPLWTFTTPVGGVSSSPAIANGRLYFAGGLDLYAFGL